MYDSLNKIGLKAVLEAIKAKIPTSLPANGGNADTVDGKHASDFIYARGYFNSIDLDDIRYPCSGLALNCTHSPSVYWGTLLVYAGGTGSFTQIYISTEDDGVLPTTMYFRHHGNTRWSDWKEISTTPIKSTTFSATTDGTGNFALLSANENKVPIYIKLDNKPFYAVPFLYYNQLWMGSTISETTRQPVANVDISGTVYYIEE